jgi:hypothetical protein
MQISEEEKNALMAVEYARKIQECTDRDDDCYRQAKEILKKHPKEAKDSKKGFWSVFGF